MKSFRLASRYVLLLASLFIALTFGLSAQAQSGNVVINGPGMNTTWPTGNYQITSLIVENGATLTIGGGSTLTVTAGVTVTGSSSIVLQGLNTSVEVNNAWVGTGVTVNAAAIQVDAGSSISADGQGYLGTGCLVPGSGPGGGPVNCNNSGNGGSYGGLGGGQNQSAMVLYGSASAPVDLGSAGSGGYTGLTGGAGGGAIRLVVSGTLTNNGAISANGVAGAVNPSAGSAGGGSGGSVYVTTGTLAGSGVFLANGGGTSSSWLVGGGGGRIAVYYNSAGSFSGFTGTAAAGSYGANSGTVVFVDTSQTNQQLNVYQQYTIPANSVATFNSITVTNGGLLTIGGGSAITVTAGITVTGNSNIVLQSLNTSAQVSGAWQGKGSTINATTIQVDTGSSINADGQGYSGTGCGVAGSGPGGGPSNCNNSGNGGSYGGLGGGQNQSAMVLYGSAAMPVDLGSGGSGEYTGRIGGAGGGAINISVSGTLTNNGAISANGIAGGIDPSAGCAGSGSGGSVYVTTAILAGSGVFLGNGGGGSNDCSVGGGGGRVAIYYNSAGSYNGFTNTTAAGGYGANNGTVVFVDTSQTNQQLNVYQQYTIPANSVSTFDNITVSNGGTLTVGGGSALTFTGGITVTGNSSIVLQSLNNSAQVNGAWQGTGSTINAPTIEVDAGSSISADGQGYPGTGCGGAGLGPEGGPVNCNNSGNGGSYGGLGGGQNQSAMSTYGSGLAPVDLGSGGSGEYTGRIGGAGGGAIRLVVSGALINNGIISANGIAGGVDFGAGSAGGGAGGSIYVTTATLSGSGVFLANGGGTSNPWPVGGGGGRIAIYYNSAGNYTGFTSTTAAGGYGGNNGTAIFVDTSQNNQKLYLYQQYVFPQNSVSSFQSINISNGGTLTIGGGSALTFTAGVTVTGNSSIVFQSINKNAQVNGVWKGQGATINAATIEVDAGSSINADGQGYPGSGCSIPGYGPGGGPVNCNNSGNGGSYGGLGGGQNQGAMSTYGSASTPTDLGSGGSGEYTGRIGGAGGGAIGLVVSGALTNNGTISANGIAGGLDPSAGSAGGGSGGSVYVTAATLNGSGAFMANGGPSSGWAVGGGGGRIAIYPNCTGFSNVTAAGGAGGTNGTIVYVCTPAVTVAPSLSSITTAQALTVTITVAGGTGIPTPTGSVILTSGSYASAATLLTGGSAQIIVPAGSLAVGSDTLTANYTPDSNSSSTYNPAAGASTTVTVINATVGTTTTLSSSLNPSTYGQSVTFTATVAQASGSTVPTGTVQFSVDGSAVGSAVTLNNGTAMYSTSTLAAGTHSITAAYAPATGSSFNSSSATALSQVVNQVSQTISFTVSSPVTYGVSPITLTATGGASGNPVTFSIVSGPGSVTGSTLTITGAGTVVVAANQAGNTNYTAAAQVTQSIVVNQASQAISFIASSPVTYGVSPITLTATGGASGNPVTFSIVSGPGSITGNTLTVTGAGTIVVAANQAGNTNYVAAAQVTQSIVVNQAASAVRLASGANPSFMQNAVTLTATVSSSAGTPTGSVSFLDGSTPLGSGTVSGGVATLTISSLAVGSHSITAAYGGDTNFLASASGVLTQLVEDFSVSVASSGGSTLTAPLGGTATDSLVVSPIGGSTLPSAVTLSISGLPAGATATFAPQTAAAGSAATNVTLTIQVPQVIANLDRGVPINGKAPPLLWGILLLPFTGRMRRAGKRLGRKLSVLLLMAIGVAAMAGLSGCGSTSGFYDQETRSYTVTVTGTSGALSHSTTITLTVQ